MQVRREGEGQGEREREGKGDEEETGDEEGEMDAAPERKWRQRRTETHLLLRGGREGQQRLPAQVEPPLSCAYADAPRAQTRSLSSVASFESSCTERPSRERRG